MPPLLFLKCSLSSLRACCVGKNVGFVTAVTALGTSAAEVEGATFRNCGETAARCEVLMLQHVHAAVIFEETFVDELSWPLGKMPHECTLRNAQLCTCTPNTVSLIDGQRST